MKNYYGGITESASASRPSSAENKSEPVHRVHEDSAQPVRRVYLDDDGIDECAIFVGGCKGITQNALASYFDRFGDVVDVRKSKNKGLKNKGFAFVTFSRSSSVQDVPTHSLCFSSFIFYLFL